MRFKDIVTTEVLSVYAPASTAADGPTRSAAAVASEAGEADTEQEERTVTARARSRDRRSHR